MYINSFYTTGKKETSGIKWINIHFFCVNYNFLYAKTLGQNSEILYLAERRDMWGLAHYFLRNYSPKEYEFKEDQTAWKDFFT